MIWNHTKSNYYSKIYKGMTENIEGFKPPVERDIGIANMYVT